MLKPRRPQLQICHGLCQLWQQVRLLPLWPILNLTSNEPGITVLDRRRKPRLMVLHLLRLRPPDRRHLKVPLPTNICIGRTVLRDEEKTEHSPRALRG